MKIINTIKLFDCPESDGGMHYEAHCGGLIKVIWQMARERRLTLSEGVSNASRMAIVKWFLR
ncbi:hypothetical protein CN934_27750 [Ensifer sp. MMN_5]|nr:hypothetical protein CN934_27750 [Ensifer sp. MMN_5]